jgi:hypothetical protein
MISSFAGQKYKILIASMVILTVASFFRNVCWRAPVNHRK